MTKQTAPCVLTIHREAFTAHFGRVDVNLGASVYYMIPLTTMTKTLRVSNDDYTGHTVEPGLGPSAGGTHREYTEDTSVSLVGLNPDVSPAEWSAQEYDPPSYPTYYTAAAAKAAIAT